jgi:hypothetical protein
MSAVCLEGGRLNFGIFQLTNSFLKLQQNCFKFFTVPLENGDPHPFFHSFRYVILLQLNLSPNFQTCKN